MIRTVASIAIATGISPNDLLDCDPDVFAEIVRILNKQAEDRNA
jgi:hypothetical protein